MPNVAEYTAHGSFSFNLYYAEPTVPLLSLYADNTS
jgi:hypothetical protein